MRINQLKGMTMTRSITLLAGAAVLAASLSGPAFSQGAPQTLSLMKVDPQSLATGYRTSKVVGSTVVNEANETVGTIDDLIVTPNEKVPFAVLSVGGFLGMGTKYVVVPYSALQVRDKNMVLPGATKDSLKSLPEFKYSN
ncbi:MAG TPA: PRC-barrel domain-containing protein [Acidimicrobiales bacterium]|nr:PRC-barrel domain-containing protein [Acidimicrobiales bacterium]